MNLNDRLAFPPADALFPVIESPTLRTIPNVSTLLC